MDVKIKDILVKENFYRIIPPTIETYSQDLDLEVGKKYISQSHFLTEYYPSGHKINSPHYYPNITKKNDDNNEVVELVSRYTAPFQFVISTKQIIHLCGNNIQFTNSNLRPSDTDKDTLINFKQSWLNHNMEVAFFESVSSEKITGDTAFCGILNKGKFSYKVFSYLKGDKLYPYYDPFTGNMTHFGRLIHRKGDNRKSQEYLEIWDDKFISRYKKNRLRIPYIYDNDGWSMISKELHGFPMLPITYKRSLHGACWSFVQHNIDQYETSISQLMQNNKSYAFPILFGKNIKNINGSTDGRPFALISEDPDADAKLLSRSDASQTFQVQIMRILQDIFMGSFTVVPPEVRSGDMPGVAIKLIYSPSLELAMKDAKEWNEFVDNMVSITKYGLGIEHQNTAQLNTLDLQGTIIPYVHQNTAEIIQNLFQSVSGGFLSKETASEKNPYALNDEYTRILKQLRDELINIDIK